MSNMQCDMALALLYSICRSVLPMHCNFCVITLHFKFKVNWICASVHSFVRPHYCLFFFLLFTWFKSTNNRRKKNNRKETKRVEKWMQKNKTVQPRGREKTLKNDNFHFYFRFGSERAHLRSHQSISLSFCVWLFL